MKTLIKKESNNSVFSSCFFKKIFIGNLNTKAGQSLQWICAQPKNCLFRIRRYDEIANVLIIVYKCTKTYRMKFLTELYLYHTIGIKFIRIICFENV